MEGSILKNGYVHPFFVVLNPRTTVFTAVWAPWCPQKAKDRQLTLRGEHVHVPGTAPRWVPLRYPTDPHQVTRAEQVSASSEFQSRQFFAKKMGPLTLPFLLPARFSQHPFLSLDVVEIVRGCEMRKNESPPNHHLPWMRLQPVSAPLTEGWASREESNGWPGKPAQNSKCQIHGTCWRHGGESKWGSPTHTLSFPISYFTKWKQRKGDDIRFSGKTMLCCTSRRANSLRPRALYTQNCHPYQKERDRNKLTAASISQRNW